MNDNLMRFNILTAVASTIPQLITSFSDVKIQAAIDLFSINPSVSNINSYSVAHTSNELLS